MGTPLVTQSRIYASTEAIKLYDALCKKRHDESARAEELEQRRIELFSDTPQAFFVAAVVGHLLQRGERYLLTNKTHKELISRDQWERPDREQLRKAFTYMVKLEYHVSEAEEVLQVVAELAERGIRHISDTASKTGGFEFTELLDKMRQETERRGRIS